MLAANQTGDVDVNQALDVIMAHPNTAPFVSGQLIRSLVTSNPSPAWWSATATSSANT